MPRYVTTTYLLFVELFLVLSSPLQQPAPQVLQLLLLLLLERVGELLQVARVLHHDLLALLVRHRLGELGAHVATDVSRQAALALLEVVENLVDGLHLLVAQVALQLRHLERLRRKRHRV